MKYNGIVMHRFFIQNEQINPKQKIIPTQDLFHQLTKVLRIRPSEKFVCIYENLELECLLGDKEIIVTDFKEFEISKDIKITLIQGIPTNKKVSMILQKATELDVDEIILWQAKRSTSKLSEFSKKEERLNKIVMEACEQSRRNDIPSISFINRLDEINFEDSDTIVLYENEDKLTYREAIESSSKKNINIVIGPEGGIDENELDLLKSKGSSIATLGKNILRTETAALAALAIITNQVR